MTIRVLIAGFQHETNAFAPTKANWIAFNRGECFPAFVRSEAMVQRPAAGNIPGGGFIQQARRQGWSLLPSCWAGATPSAHVARDAFQRIAAVILADLCQEIEQGGVDAVCLDLQGAVVTEHLDDVEGELLAQVRAVVGADALVCYRTYPHIDMAVASARSQMLDRELFRHLGIHPEQMKLLVNKSSVHFRADFAPIAQAILVAKAAGPMAADPAALPWRQLPPSMARCS